MAEFVIGCLIFLVIALYVWAVWKSQQRKNAKHMRGVPPRTRTGRTYGGIVDAISGGWMVVRIEPDEPGEPARLHLRDRGGVIVGDHLTIEEYSDSTWEPVVSRDEVDR